MTYKPTIICSRCRFGKACWYEHCPNAANVSWTRWINPFVVTRPSDWPVRLAHVALALMAIAALIIAGGV